ncbi:SET domain protein [Planctomycetes bacterium Pan216]|uniref:SET domain protein n=1 Tax=Kolteria novifilia TaxID=2527975 RepID=A0A518B5I0_9BACT|nr:SET domain protein [Planctomycetes bacterium Pan216]
MAFCQSELIEVRKIPGKGRGVVARRTIPKGVIFERCPVLVLPNDEIFPENGESKLSYYVFEWGKDTVALALGYGSLYNHSYSPNARYDDAGVQTKIFSALREIQAGEEITINYNGEPSKQIPVGFDVIENKASANGR